ncbi:MAG: hypothetical protein ABI852_03635 [Gemmatimonadaceae bacterium]
MTKLSRRSRILVLISAILLSTASFLPLWKIQLHAPQYPEGIGMLIRIDTLTGVKPNDLDNINGLNHYIGMKPITPDLFPVLHVMPWVLGTLVVLSLLTAASGWRALLTTWLLATCAAGIAGLTEFYLWSYDYGHNLAADAIIKIPGMTYQPPLIGSKQLLNFTAVSLPDLGGLMLCAAFVIGAVAMFLSVRQQPFRLFRLANSGYSAAVLLLTFLCSCKKPDTPQILYGKADCAVCNMRIVDNRFGGAAVTDKGKTRQFDSIACLANYVASMTSLQSVWVSDFDHPGTLLRADSARFVFRDGPTSEMGSDLIAVSNATGSADLDRRFKRASVTWSEVRRRAQAGALGVDHSTGSDTLTHVPSGV